MDNSVIVIIVNKINWCIQIKNKQYFLSSLYHVCVCVREVLLCLCRLHFDVFKLLMNNTFRCPLSCACMVGFILSSPFTNWCIQIINKHTTFRCPISCVCICKSERKTEIRKEKQSHRWRRTFQVYLMQEYIYKVFHFGQIKLFYTFSIFSSFFFILLLNQLHDVQTIYRKGKKESKITF